MTRYDSVEPHPDFPKIEKEILAFWEKEQIFEKSLAQTKDGKPYTFYDGPPFATGLPHYGHILASTIKDVIPRYQTMKGRFVRRRWGWDCHGLPIEELVERELGISGKKEIEKIGIKKFNETCRATVLRYVEEWGKMVRRIARWIDFDNAYKTMDADYMESVWWAFSKIYKKGLVYEGRKVLLYCPRCETPISNFEVAMDQSYRDVEEEAVTVKFKVKNPKPDNPIPNTYLLAWTTTPWTLAGNVALAVSEDIDYLEVELPSGGSASYILAKDRASVLGEKYRVIRTFKGKDLVGLEYEPLFDVPAVKPDKSFRVYGADFVTTEEGTGIVHTAVVYGEEDYELGLREGLPVIPLLDEKGVFNSAAPELVRGKYFKEAEAVIVHDLEERGFLFARGRHLHSYPYCWRCETQLFYNAIPAWFINVQKIKKDLLKTNKREMNWYPAHLKHGRYENSVKDAPDWNISRNRYWGNPIPVWRCDSCGHATVIGSLEELNKHRFGKTTTLMLMRHGEAVSNEQRIFSSHPETFENPLTAKGRAAVERAARKLSGAGITRIISSDLLRTRQTASIVGELLGLPVEASHELREIDVGVLNGRPIDEYDNFFKVVRERLGKSPDGGETWLDVDRRVWSFARACAERYRGETVLIVSHGLPLVLLESRLRGVPDGRFSEWHDEHELAPGEFRAVDFPNWPFNDRGEIDLHRPYVDGVVVKCEECGGASRRIVEIFDSWMEAASMPFAEYHYPFENKREFQSRFPAQFVAEYIAQTRAWFYTMHVVSQNLFGRAPFENIVTTGTILAEDGSKMSKSKSNFPDPWKVIEAYGVDSLRFYLMNSAVMQADNLNFSERDLRDSYRKVTLILWNVYNYFTTYANEAGWQSNPETPSGETKESQNHLDRWITARLKELLGGATDYLDKYDTVRATRLIDDFINDLSTWYLRRSRGRRDSAFFATLSRTLIYLARVMAPITPYISEYIYRGIGVHPNYPISVHLTKWPGVEKISKDEKRLVENMATVRRLASAALARRAKAGIKVRQKLSRLSVNAEYRPALDGLEEILVDEVNVLEIDYDKTLGSGEVRLDTQITVALEREGVLRGLIRTVNEMRKEKGLTPNDRIRLFIRAERSDTTIDDFSDSSDLIKEKTRADSIEPAQEPHPALDIEREYEDSGWKIKVGFDS